MEVKESFQVVVSLFSGLHVKFAWLVMKTEQGDNFNLFVTITTSLLIITDGNSTYKYFKHINTQMHVYTTQKTNHLYISFILHQI